MEVLWSKPVDKKLYNARKTLTKAFTHGSEIVDNESGTVQVKLDKYFFYFCVVLLRYFWQVKMCMNVL